MAEQTKHFHEMTFGEMRTEAYRLRNEAMELDKADPQRRELLKKSRQMTAHANAGCCGE